MKVGGGEGLRITEHAAMDQTTLTETPTAKRTLRMWKLWACSRINGFPPGGRFQAAELYKLPQHRFLALLGSQANQLVNLGLDPWRVWVGIAAHPENLRVRGGLNHSLLGPEFLV